MCLIKTHKWPKISEDKIEVYKVLLCTGNNGLLTPYMKEEVKDMKLEAKCFDTDTTASKYTIDGEGVHAFIDYTAAIEEWLCWVQRYNRMHMLPKIYKAIIPPKTNYWVGKYFDIAATKLLIKEPMPDPSYIK